MDLGKPTQYSEIYLCISFFYSGIFIVDIWYIQIIDLIVT